MTKHQPALLIFMAVFIMSSLNVTIYQIILSIRYWLEWILSGMYPEAGWKHVPTIVNNYKQFPKQFLHWIAERYGITQHNYIKPGIGEATRVLLRREAQLLLLQDLDSEATRHLRWLAESKSIPIAVFKDLPYRAVALIKEIEL